MTHEGPIGGPHGESPLTRFSEKFAVCIEESEPILIEEKAKEKMGDRHHMSKRGPNTSLYVRPIDGSTRYDEISFC